MSIKDTKQPGGSSKRGATRRTIKEKLASSSKAEADLMVSASKSGDSFHSIELKQLVGPILESQMNPSEPFIADDFLSPYDSYDQPAKKDLPDLKKHERELQARKRERSRRPRMAAFNIFRKSDEDLSMEGFPPPENDTESESILREDINMTTPLHEAARLGSGDFIRFLLANGGDPNVKNGHARTALHMCAGGFTVEENRLTQAMSSKKETNKNNDAPIGIRAPAIPPEVFALMNGDATKNSSEKGTARKAAKAVGRMIQSLRSPVKEKSRAGNGNSVVNFKPKPDPARLNHLVTERMDAALAVLSWIHEETGEGASINAVDSDGRTALHYAAEMGRSDICMIILSNFGAMLTIIDELGARTPCELAGVQGHSELAAQLEARAVLYIDPYGVDDELMANYLNAEMDGDDEDGNRTNLVAPFSWFETSTLEQMGEEREKRLQTAHLKMKKALQQWECGRDMKKVMASATKVGLNAALSDDENDAETDNAGDGEKAGSASENENSSGGWEVLMTSAEVVDMDAALGIEPDGSAAEKSEKASAIKTDEGSCNSEDKDVDDVQVAFSNMQNSHVERFLAHHKWHVSQAIKVFRKSPGEAFVEAGVPLPSTSIPQKNGKMEERMCLICYDDVVEKDNWVKLSGCIHGFCADCLRDFVKDCAASKLASVSITCPHHECEVVMSQEDIDSLLLEIPDVAARITEANNEQFVSSAYDFRFCTHPGCPGIVKRLPQPFYTKNNIDLSLLNYVGGVCTADPSNDEKPIGDGCTMTYEGVEDLEYNNCRSLDQPRKAHRFCFACGEGMHWPVRCEQIEQWKQKMREEIGEVDEDGENDKNVNDMAQKLWLKANTRPCPQCNVPIEKNDGCNHMTCTSPSCRHEFWYVFFVFGVLVSRALL
jgi:ankyrin repeat protein